MLTFSQAIEKQETPNDSPNTTGQNCIHPHKDANTVNIKVVED